MEALCSLSDPSCLENGGGRVAEPRSPPPGLLGVTPAPVSGAGRGDASAPSRLPGAFPQAARCGGREGGAQKAEAA